MSGDPSLPLGSRLIATVRLMEGKALVATFCYLDEADDVLRWREMGYRSRAWRSHSAKRESALDGATIPDEYQAAWEMREHELKTERPHHPYQRGNLHLHRLIGDEPYNQAYRHDWDELSPSQIPGYREVYVFGRLTARAEKLYAALDGVRAAGLDRVQLDALRKFL